MILIDWTQQTKVKKNLQTSTVVKFSFLLIENSYTAVKMYGSNLRCTHQRSNTIFSTLSSHDVPVAANSVVSRAEVWGALTAIWRFTPLDSSCFSRSKILLPCKIDGNIKHLRGLNRYNYLISCVM